jgi:uncharacterized membrane protein YqjE
MEESARPTIVSLARSLLADLRGLLTKELQLAKHEMQHEVSKVVKAAILTGVAAILSLMAVILLCLTLVYVEVALLAAAGAGVLGYLVMKLGSSLRLWPFRTLRTVKEDAQWIKEQVLSSKT